MSKHLPDGRGAILYAETQAEAERQKRAYQASCIKKDCAEVRRSLDRDWEWRVTWYRFPQEQGKHLQATNRLESPVAVVLLTAAAKWSNHTAKKNAVA